MNTQSQLSSPGTPAAATCWDLHHDSYRGRTAVTHCRKFAAHLLQYILAGALMIAASGRAVAQQPIDLTGKTIDQLLQLMDDNNFSVRQDATAELKIRMPKLNKDDLAKVVAAYFDGSLEVQRRIDPLLKDYLVDLGNSPKATAALGLMEVRFTKYDDKKDLNAKIKFGDFAGEVPVNVFGKEAEWKVYNDLKARWAAYRNYIRIGDTDGATARLDEMKTFINGLSNLQLGYLNLTNSDGKAVTKDDVLEAIAAAKLLTKQAKQEIMKKMGMVPDPRRMIPVAAAGPLNLGKTVALNIGTVLNPGNVDYTWSDAQLDYGPAPVGYAIVGPLYDMQADATLAIAGAVSISIQYGGSEGDAYGIKDPSQLAIVRVGGDGYQFLDAFNDLGSHTITAVYKIVDPSNVDYDQFGEFMLVTPSGVTAGSVKYYQVDQNVVMVSASK